AGEPGRRASAARALRTRPASAGPPRPAVRIVGLPRGGHGVTAPVVSGARNDLRWAAGAVATVLLAFGLVLVGNHHYFWYGDTAAAYYGWWYHLGDLVRHGDWTTLDPHAWRAGNYAAEGQWALWSPLTIGIGLLATVVGDMLFVTTLVKLGLVALGVVGVYLLVRSYDAPPPAAYTAG